MSNDAEIPDDHFWPSFAAWRAAYDEGAFDDASSWPDDARVLLTLRVLADGSGGADAAWVHAVHAPASAEALALEAACTGPARDFLGIHEELAPHEVPSAVLEVCFTQAGAPAARGMVGPLGAPDEGCVPPSVLVATARRFLDRS